MNEFMKIIASRRSVRRFEQRRVDESLLVEFVSAARCAPSAANRQPLEYVIVSDPKVCLKIFELVAWAGFVRPNRNPGPGEEPTAYIIVLVNRDITGGKGSPADAGAAIENLILAAWSEGIGSCWMGAIDRLKIIEILNIPENMSIDSLVAMGYPAETPVMEDARGQDAQAVRYYLDDNDTLHVPKRRLREIVHMDRYGDLPKNAW